MNNKVYDKNNRLTYYSYEDSERIFDGNLNYDIRGNMIWWEECERAICSFVAKEQSYSYDAFGYMTEFVDYYYGVGVDYKYNSSGLRTS